eukprot:scaffold117895_cov29-Tisochrysis_lutea.AAC.3
MREGLLVAGARRRPQRGHRNEPQRMKCSHAHLEHQVKLVAHPQERRRNCYYSIPPTLERSHPALRAYVELLGMDASILSCSYEDHEA